VEIRENTYQFVVPQHQAKIRLDKYLCEIFTTISRSYLQKLIEESFITVNGKSAKASHLILPSEKIEVTFPKPKISEIQPENIPLTIVYEDENLLVINKSAGMVVHPAYGNMTGTMVNALLYHCRTLSGIGGVKRPGIVHRLDKDTSGLLVVAKDDYTHQQLSLQFSNRTIEREYFAIVWGAFSEPSGRIESLLTRSTRDRTKIVSTKNRGKHAVTHFQVLDYYNPVSLIFLKLETGRTHQIRVHLSSMGHPVVGDATYGGRNKQIIPLNQQQKKTALEILRLMPRQALHAKMLGFSHPVTNKFLAFNSDLPSDIQELIRYLKQLHDE